jgi:hypothetical protein
VSGEEVKKKDLGNNRHRSADFYGDAGDVMRKGFSVRDDLQQVDFAPPCHVLLRALLLLLPLFYCALLC